MTATSNDFMAATTSVTEGLRTPLDHSSYDHHLFLAWGRRHGPRDKLIRTLAPAHAYLFGGSATGVVLATRSVSKHQSDERGYDEALDLRVKRHWRMHRSHRDSTLRRHMRTVCGVCIAISNSSGTFLLNTLCGWMGSMFKTCRTGACMVRQYCG